MRKIFQSGLHLFELERLAIHQRADEGGGGAGPAGEDLWDRDRGGGAGGCGHGDGYAGPYRLRRRRRYPPSAQDALLHLTRPSAHEERLPWFGSRSTPSLYSRPPRPRPLLVDVFQNQPLVYVFVAVAAAQLDQLHGSEPAEYAKFRNSSRCPSSGCSTSARRRAGTWT